MRIEAERAAAMRRAEKALGQQLQLNKELLQQLKQSGILTRSNGVSNVGAFNSSSSNVSTGEARAVESLLRDRLGHFKLDKVNSN